MKTLYVLPFNSNTVFILLCRYFFQEMWKKKFTVGGGAGGGGEGEREGRSGYSKHIFFFFFFFFFAL